MAMYVDCRRWLLENRAEQPAHLSGESDELKEKNINGERGLQ